MFMMRQGDISNAKRVDELEKRVEMLENVVKALQCSERPKVGRPPKAKDESEPKSHSSS
jgi:chaperonin cofactor prefoldin